MKRGGEEEDAIGGRDSRPCLGEDLQLLAGGQGRVLYGLAHQIPVKCWVSEKANDASRIKLAWAIAST